MTDARHDELLALLTRREALTRASATGLGALVTAALPAALLTAPAARAATPSLTDATLQAFSDTILPGRRVTVTEAGNAIHPLAIAGVDPLPGAVEADSLALYHHPEVGFDALEPVFIADLDAMSLRHGGGPSFLSLSFANRVKACLAGLDFNNPTRLIWEAAAAIPFTAFCASALVVNATAKDACGYRVMGLPGVAPNGYTGFSYRRQLSHERTKHGSLP